MPGNRNSGQPSKEVAAEAKRLDLMTRADVAKRLGVGHQAVAKLENQGKIRPFRIDARSKVRYFAPEDIEKFRTERLMSRLDRDTAEGEIAARLFEMFERDMTFIEIVKELRVHPDVVRRFYDEYLVGLDEGHVRRMKAQDQETKMKAEVRREREKRRAEEAEKEAERERRRAEAEMAKLQAMQDASIEQAGVPTVAEPRRRRGGGQPS